MLSLCTVDANAKGEKNGPDQFSWNCLVYLNYDNTYKLPLSHNQTFIQDFIELLETTDARSTQLVIKENSKHTNSR